LYKNFTINNSQYYQLSIGCYKKYVEMSDGTKFLGFQIKNHLNWKNAAG